MNKQLEAFARETLKDGLALCTEGQQMIFKRMYSPTFLEAPINKVVGNMDVEKLDWAMTQVSRTVADNAKKAGAA